MIDRKTIGIRLMLLRQAKGFNQGDLSQLLKLDQSKLSRLEKAEYKNLDLDLLQRVLQEFACPGDVFFHQESEKFLEWLTGDNDSLPAEAFTLRSFLQGEKQNEANQITTWLTSQLPNSHILIYGTKEAGKTSLAKAILKEAKIADILIIDNHDAWKDWGIKHTHLLMSQGDVLTEVATMLNQTVTIFDGWQSGDAKEIGLYKLLSSSANQGIITTIDASTAKDALTSFDSLVSARAGKTSSSDLNLPTANEYYDLMLEVVSEKRGDKSSYHLQRIIQPIIDREGIAHLYSAYTRGSRLKGQSLNPVQ